MIRTLTSWWKSKAGAVPKPTRRTVALSAAPMFPAYEELMDEQDGSGAGTIES